MRHHATVICPVCQKEFVQDYNKSACCSRKCGSTFANKKRAFLPEFGTCAYCQRPIPKKYYRIEKHCSRKCGKLHAEERKKAAENIEDIFWSKVDKSGGPDACWLWTGVFTNWGYGRFTYNRTLYTSHRLSYQFSKGEIPEGLVILHACDVKACCNPAHLSVGTCADNSKDMVTKGRSARGERNANSKLTDQQVLEIRNLRRENGIQIKQLAKLFNCSDVTIDKVLNGRGWTHI